VGSDSTETGANLGNWSSQEEEEEEEEEEGQ